MRLTRIRYFDEGDVFQEGDVDDTLNEDGDMGDDVDHYGDEEIVHSRANGGVPANVDSY